MFSCLKMERFRAVLLAWMVILCGFWVISVSAVDDGWGEWAEEARTKRFVLTLQQGKRSIGCMDSVVMVVNGTYVGPTLEVDEGDNVEVLVLNKMNNLGATIHFHGVKQKGTPWADGTAYVSQCPIPPLNRFTYRFNADKAGTFWYHGHQLLGFASGYGAFIVHPKEKKFDYDEDAGVIHLGNQYMQSLQGIIVGLRSNPFTFPGIPQALLANGKGIYNCTAFSECLTCTYGDSCRHLVKYLQPDTKYLLRLTNTGMLAFLTVGIQQIPMKVVQTNTGILKPFKTDYLDIGNGQSYSVIIKTPKKRGHYWLQAIMRFSSSEGLIPARVLLDTTTSHNYPKETPSADGFPSTDDIQFSRKFMDKLKSNETENLNPEYDQLWTIVSEETKHKNNIRWSLNNYTFQFPDTPALLANQYGVALKRNVTVKEPPVPYDYLSPRADQGLSEYSNLGLNLLTAEYGQRIRIVLQNGLTSRNTSEPHPFHMHGGDYWVLGRGRGIFNATKDMEKLNFKNPPMQSTTYLLASEWTVIEFLADNPGFWLMHCHIGPHATMGMELVIAVATEMIPEIPGNHHICGEVTVNKVLKHNNCRAQKTI